MVLSTHRTRSSRRVLQRIGRALALVAQLVVLFAPLAEAREDRLLGSHVEAPRKTAHPGHHAETCPACVLLSVHSRPAERAGLDELTHRSNTLPPASPAYADAAERAFSNSSRAPPLCS